MALTVAVPVEPAAVSLLDDQARLRLFRMRNRLRERNGWPMVEKLCRCGRLFPTQPRVRLCPECRRKRKPAPRNP